MLNSLTWCWFLNWNFTVVTKMPVSSQLCTFSSIYSADIFVSNGPKSSDLSSPNFCKLQATWFCLIMDKQKRWILIQTALKFEWFFCLWFYFDHTDSVISKIRRLRYMKYELSAWIQWALLKITEVATLGHLCH